MPFFQINIVARFEPTSLQPTSSARRTSVSPPVAPIPLDPVDIFHHHFNSSSSDLTYIRIWNVFKETIHSILSLSSNLDALFIHPFSFFIYFHTSLATLYLSLHFYSYILIYFQTSLAISLSISTLILFYCCIFNYLHFYGCTFISLYTSLATFYLSLHFYSYILVYFQTSLALSLSIFTLPLLYLNLCLHFLCSIFIYVYTSIATSFTNTSIATTFTNTSIATS